MASGILERLRGDISEYKPVVLWKWNGSLEISRLNAQLDEIKASGAGGAVISAGKGLETAYLSEDWFKCVSAALERADRLRLRLWVAPDIRYSSLLREEANRARSLICRREERFDPKALGCYRIENGKLYRLTDDDGSACACVYACTLDEKPDLLNWKVVRALIDEGCEGYYRRYARFFGNLLSGFYLGQDLLPEGQISYSDALSIKYRQRFGEDILNELGALFLPCAQAESFRYQYWTALNELYAEAFASQIYRWCAERNCKLTGAWAGQDGIGEQMFGAGEMPVAEFEQLPAVRVSDEIGICRAASAAAQLGKGRVLLDLALKQPPQSLMDLRHRTEAQLVYGVTQLSLHACPFETRGSRKRDGFMLYAENGAYNSLLKPFNRYFTYLNYLLSNSRAVVDTLVIYPMRSAYAHFDAQNDSAVKSIGEGFRVLVDALSERGIMHHYGDEALIRKYGGIKNGKLTVGKYGYSSVVVPDIDLLDESTVDLLDAFAKGGGKLCLAGGRKLSFASAAQKTVVLESTASLDELTNPGFGLSGDTQSVRASVRRSDFGDFIYTVNTSLEETQSVLIHINAPGARRFRLEKPGFAPLYFKKEARGIDIPLTLAPGASEVVFLSSRAESAPEEVPDASETVPAPEAIIEQADPNILPLNAAMLSFDGESYSSVMPLEKIRTELMEKAVNRTVYLKYCFFASAKPAGLTLRCERGSSVLCTLNGIELAPDTAQNEDGEYAVYALNGALRIGRNELTVRLDYYQSEAVYAAFQKGTEGSILPDTEIEAMYLMGDFCLDKRTEAGGNAPLSDQYSLTLPKRYVSLAKLSEEGFPCFSGSMRVRTLVRAHGGETRIRVRGAYFALKLSVNGGEEIPLVLSDTAILPEALKPGDNALRLTLHTGSGALPGEGIKTELGIDVLEIG